MLFYVATIAAVLLTLMYLGSSEPSRNAKIAIGGLAALSVFLQMVVGTQPVLVLAILLQVIISFAVMIQLKLLPVG